MCTSYRLVVEEDCFVEYDLHRGIIVMMIMMVMINDSDDDHDKTGNFSRMGCRTQCAKDHVSLVFVGDCT